MLKNSIIVTGLTILARGLGFLVTVIIASRFGVSTITDAYYIASTIPSVVITVFISSLVSVLVPSFAKWLVSGSDAGRQIFGAYLTVSLVLAIAITLIIELAAPPLTSLLNNGVPAETLSLSLHLVQVLVLMIPFSVLVGAFSAALNAQQHFVSPALVPAVDALVSIGVILVGYQSLGIFAAALGVILGEVVSALWMAVMVARSGVRVGLTLRIPGEVWHDLRLTLPLVVGALAIQLNPMIDRIMAAFLAGGGNVATFDYADRVLMIPASLLYSGFLVVSLSHWSDMVARNQGQTLRASVQSSLIAMVFIVAPLALGLFALRQPVIDLFYAHGAIDAQAAGAIASVTGILSLGLLPNAVGLVFTRLILAYRRPAVLMVIGLLNTGLNAALNLVLMQPFGLDGIALSTAITYTIICFVLILYCVFARIAVIDRKLIIKLGKVLLAAAALFVAVQIVVRLLAEAPPLVLIVAAAAVGGAVYALIAYVQHLEEIDAILARIWAWCRAAVKFGTRVG
jgi:putative peptidoglycan lipid II flippase